jgi:hypothetical protein
MQKIYTENDIVRYIYREMGPAESLKIEAAIEKDASLKAFHLQLLEVIRRMDSVSQNAHPSSIELILEHSKASSHLEASI